MDSKGSSKKTKITFQVDSPFSGVEWPAISIKNQNTILELLINLLSPIGTYRSNHIVPSKGKRAKKRKRHEQTKDPKAAEAPEATEDPTTPPPPEVLSHILVGLNTITRHLQTLSTISRPENFSSVVEGETNDGDGDAEISKNTDSAPVPPHIAAIFVTKFSHPSILYSHLPMMVTTASAAHPDKLSTRLVELPRDCEIRLCESLGLPRAGFVAVFDDEWPQSRALLDFTREHVPSVELDWLKQARNPEFRPTRINVYGGTA